MDISINTRDCIHEKDGSPVSEYVKAYFLQKFPKEKFEWECSGTRLTTSLQTEESEIIRVFEELVKKYPELDIDAFYSYEIREDDRSAQWWTTVRIRTEKEDGETKIVCSASTYWN